MNPSRKVSAVHHELLSSDPGIKVSSDRVLGIVFGVFFAVVAGLPRLRGGSIRWWSIGASLAFFAAALAAPRILHPLNVVWARFALLLHRVVSPMAMALLFFLGFAVTGLLLRAFGKDLLRLKAWPDRESYWIPRDPPGPAPDSLLRQF